MAGNLSLGELIQWLDEQDQAMTIRDGFASPHSDRGSYDELAFDSVDVTTIEQMLAHAKSALGASFHGYKGGIFKMHEFTPVHIGEFGTCGESITPTHLKYWMAA